MNILGLAFYYHDSAAALLVDGRIAAMAEEERFSRIKNDAGYPEKAIDFSMKQAGMRFKDLDAVVFYEKPFLKFERILLAALNTYPRGIGLFGEAMKEWLFQKLWVKELLMSKLGVEADKIFFSEHHLSHAASAYYPSGLKESAVVTIDGVGEWATTTIGYGKSSELKILKEIRFPHSLGLLYSTVTAFLGFEVNEGEYKVMGMAGFGKPRYVNKVRKLVKLCEDGSFSLDSKYFAFPYSGKKMFNDKFIEMFGEPRKKDSLFFTQKSGFPRYFGDKPRDFEILAQRNQEDADLAASLQVVCEEAVVNLVRSALKQTGSNNLCLAGGVGLNAVINGKIKEQFKLKNFFVQPAAGDAGGALGAALYYYNKQVRQPKAIVMKQAGYGQEYNDEEIYKILVKLGRAKFKIEKCKSEKEMLDLVVDNLVKGKVVGWFQGRFEWGPRALGNRSILGDPRNPKMKDIVNAKIKFREPYRPFAPSVLAERVEEYFDYSQTTENDPASFMTIVCKVKKHKRKVIPAVTHVDGTARLQVVHKVTNPLYWNLIEAFYKKTGVPVILNTSFNVKGEPMVASPEDACRTFMKSGLDMMVIGKYSVTKL